MTKTGLVVGTPEYMSPEQLAGDKLDGRSDIYSLGLVAFNMLTGLLPFPSDSAQESMIMRLTDRPKMLSDMRPEVAWPADLQAVMDKALSRDASQRYQTAPAFGREFYRAIERMPSTKAAQAGTQVLDAAAAAAAVPATRVDVGAAADAERTVAIPAPTMPAAPIPTASARAASGSKNRWLMAGVPLVLVGGVVVAMMLNGGPKTNGTGTETPPSTSAMQPKKTDSVPGVTSPSQKPDSSQAITNLSNPKRPVESPGAQAKATGPAPVTGKSVEAQLEALAKDARVANNHDRVDRELKRLAPQAKSSIELYWLAIAQADLLRQENREADACTILENAKKNLNDDDKEKVRRRMEGYSCGSASLTTH